MYYNRLTIVTLTVSITGSRISTHKHPELLCTSAYAVGYKIKCIVLNLASTIMNVYMSCLMIWQLLMCNASNEL